jgi:hypothetical protein
MVFSQDYAEYARGAGMAKKKNNRCARSTYPDFPAEDEAHIHCKDTDALSHLTLRFLTLMSIVS